MRTYGRFTQATSPFDYFQQRIERVPGVECWFWVGTVDKDGYGALPVKSAKGMTRKAHRLAVIFDGRDCPRGAEVRHTCDTPCCVNPDHLIVGTHMENVADMLSKGRGYRPAGALTHCKRGHALVGENAGPKPHDCSLSPRCRQCGREDQRRAAAAKRAPFTCVG